MCDQESFGLVQDENRDMKERLEKIHEAVDAIFDRIVRMRSKPDISEYERLVNYQDYWLKQIREYSKPDD